MRALAVTPGRPGSARLDDVPEPPASDGSVLVETLAVGVCGTDLEIISGDYGEAPPGEDYLARVGRLNALRKQAEEIVLAELVLLPPEPGASGDDPDN